MTDFLSEWRRLNDLHGNLNERETFNLSYMITNGAASEQLTIERIRECDAFEKFKHG